MKRRTAKMLSTLVVLALVILTMVFHDQYPVQLIILLVGLSILSILSQFLCCPYCGVRYGWKRSVITEYCPNCGEYLDDDL